MTFYHPDNLAAVTGGRWRGSAPAPGATGGVGTDTRADLTGHAFIALAGERFDGHDHLAAACDAGATMAVVEAGRAADAPDGLPLLEVASTRDALVALGAAYRRTLTGATVIGITGSAGKTTTKRLVHAMLAADRPGTAAPRSFNNEIGVPLTLLSASPSDRYVVVEIGTNAPGEIARLAAVAAPDVGIVTSIGHAHVGGFGDRSAIRREKAALPEAVGPGGLVVVPASEPGLLDHVDGRDRAVVRFGAEPPADARLADRGMERSGDERAFWFDVASGGRTARFAIDLPGRHNAMNAMTAVITGRWLGVPDATIRAGLAGAGSEPMRMTRVEVGGVVVHNDAYNANPESMTAALDAFTEVAADAPRRIVVLGDMLELGDAAPALHRALGGEIRAAHERAPLAHVFLVGTHAPSIAAGLTDAWPDAPHTMLGEAAADGPDDGIFAPIGAHLRPGDAVLLKASRGLRLERVIDAIRRSAATRQPIEA